MITKKKIESYLPVFTGFYGTNWEPNEDNVIEHPYDYDDYKFFYDEYRNEVARGCVNSIESKLLELGIKLKIKFEGICSPREYNFVNDSIDVEYTLYKNTGKAIYDYLTKHKTEFAKYVKDRFTSYDGFISFYSNDVDTWLTEYAIECESVHFETFLAFILLNEGYTDDELYEENYEISLGGELKDEVETVQNKVRTYTNDNYLNTTKNVTIITAELMEYFDENNIYPEYLTFDYVETMVLEIFNDIEKNTLSLFANVK